MGFLKGKQRGKGDKSISYTLLYHVALLEPLWLQVGVVLRSNNSSQTLSLDTSSMKCTDEVTLTPITYRGICHFQPERMQASNREPNN